MNFEQLLTYLELEEAAEFEYFEAMADLLESEEYIEMEAMYQLFEGAENTMITELLQDYFEDILEGLPDDSGEIYSLMHQIKMTLIGLSSSLEDESDLRKFTDEFYKFQTWYSFESEVELLPEDGGRPYYCNVRDAITTFRLENLGGEKFRYNFENCLEYELDSYEMSFNELAMSDDDNDGTIIFSPEEDMLQN